MVYHSHYDERHSQTDYNDDYELDSSDAGHKKEIRRKLEERMERRRLKEELEDFDGELDDEFDWEQYDK